MDFDAERCSSDESKLYLPQCCICLCAAFVSVLEAGGSRAIDTAAPNEAQCQWPGHVSGTPETRTSHPVRVAFAFVLGNVA